MQVHVGGWMFLFQTPHHGRLIGWVSHDVVTSKAKAGNLGHAAKRTTKESELVSPCPANLNTVPSKPKYRAVPSTALYNLC